MGALTLEEALAEIAAANSLTVVEVGMNLSQKHECSRFNVTVHWDGYSASGNRCVFGYGATTTEAMANALEAAAKARIPVVVAPDALPTLAEAA